MNRKFRSFINNGKTIFLTFLSVFCFFTTNFAQDVVTIPKSEITTTAKFYEYDYLGKTLKYFAVISPNGNIKVAFDACDVCYDQYKGYIQSGTEMECGNCGNLYAMDSLGTNNSGGCWPSYLVHTEVGDNIEIEKSKIEEKEWMFDGNTFIKPNVSTWNKSSFSIRQHEKFLVIKMPSNVSRRIDIVSMNGKTLISKISSSNLTHVNIQSLSSGNYIITIFNSNSRPFNKRFSISI